VKSERGLSEYTLSLKRYIPPEYGSTPLCLASKQRTYEAWCFCSPTQICWHEWAEGKELEPREIDLKKQSSLGMTLGIVNWVHLKILSSLKKDVSQQYASTFFTLRFDLKVNGQDDMVLLLSNRHMRN
jgi:hypothetical protein